MPFYRMDFGDGKTGVVHLNLGRRRGSPPCVAPRLETDDPAAGAKCGRMSVALCDFVVGKRVEMGDPMGDRTCDAPVCERHRTTIGPNRDHCWRHAKQQALPELRS